MSKELPCLRPVVLFLVLIVKKHVNVTKMLKSFDAKDRKRKIDLLAMLLVLEVFVIYQSSQHLLKLNSLLLNQGKLNLKRNTITLLMTVMYAVRSSLSFIISTIVCALSVLSLTIVNVFKLQTLLDKWPLSLGLV